MRTDLSIQKLVNPVQQRNALRIRRRRHRFQKGIDVRKLGLRHLISEWWHRTFWPADIIHKGLECDRVLGQPRAGSSLTRIAVAACAAMRLELFLSVFDVARSLRLLLNREAQK